MTMGSNNPRKLLLRAELRHRGTIVIAHTLEFSQSMVFVQTDYEAEPGARINVEFSFPGLLSPFELETQVVARTSAVEPTGLTLGFLFYSQSEKQAIRRLLPPIAPLTPAPIAIDTSPVTDYRVLVVEDNEFVREAFAFSANRLLLDVHRVVVEMVADSTDALQRVFERRYDLAIVDYFLPTANGDRLISRMRSNPGLATLPIFAFSAGGADVRRASLDAGANLFLNKPAVMRSLFPTLVHLHALRRHVGVESSAT